MKPGFSATEIWVDCKRARIGWREFGFTILVCLAVGHTGVIVKRSSSSLVSGFVENLKFRTRLAQGFFRKGICVVACHVVSSTCFCMLVAILHLFCLCTGSLMQLLCSRPPVGKQKWKLTTIIYQTCQRETCSAQMRARKLRARNAQISGPKLTP